MCVPAALLDAHRNAVRRAGQSITVRWKNPAPSGSQVVLAAASRSTGAPSTSQVRGGDPPSAFKASGAPFAPAASPRSMALPSSGKTIFSVSGAETPFPGGGNSPCAAKRRSGGGSAAVLRAESLPAEPEWIRDRARASRRHRKGWAPPRRARRARHRPIVRAANPHRDGRSAVEARRPGIAVAVGRARLEGDAIRCPVERRRGALENVGDIPGGRRLGEAHRRRRRLVEAPHENRDIPSPRQPGIKPRDILERRPDPTEADRQTWRCLLRQNDPRARRSQSRDEAFRVPPVKSAIAGRLSDICKARRAVTAP